MSFKDFMNHFYNINIFDDTFQRLSRKVKQYYHQKYLEYKEPTEGDKL